MSSLFRKLLFKFLGMFASHFHSPPLDRAHGKGKGCDTVGELGQLPAPSSLGGDKDMSCLSQMAQSSPHALLGEEGLPGGGGGCSPLGWGSTQGLVLLWGPCARLCGVAQCHLNVGWRVLVLRSRFG